MALDSLKNDSGGDFMRALTVGCASSASGAVIFNFLKRPSCRYDVIVLGQGQNFGQMLTEYDQSSPDVVTARAAYMRAFPGRTTIERPVVLWNPNYNFDYFGDVEGVTVNQSGSMQPIAINQPGGYLYRYQSSGKSQVCRVVSVTRATMPAWIVLYHELGHLKQYFEGGDTAAARENAWKTRLGNSDAIEADNLERHEHWLCRGANLPIRSHYKHSVVGFNDLLQSYMTPAKMPAFRQSASTAERIVKDRELLAVATANRDAGVALAPQQQPAAPKGPPAAPAGSGKVPPPPPVGSGKVPPPPPGSAKGPVNPTAQVPVGFIFGPP